MLNLGISTKIAGLLTLLVIISSVWTGQQIYKGSEDVLVLHEKGDLNDEAKINRDWILSQFAQLREDGHYLASMPEVQAFGEHADNFDAELRAKLEDRLKPVCQRGEYLQVRLLDAHGFEKAKIEKKQIGKGRFTYESSDLLTDKSERPYFQETQRRKPGDIYTSRLELNVEDGKVQKQQPVVRVAVPLYAEDYVHGTRLEPFGVVVINYDLQIIIDKLNGSYRHLAYLTDEAGNFLVHPDMSQTFLWCDSMTPQKGLEHSDTNDLAILMAEVDNDSVDQVRALLDEGQFHYQIYEAPRTNAPRTQQPSRKEFRIASSNLESLEQVRNRIRQEVAVATLKGPFWRKADGSIYRLLPPKRANELYEWAREGARARSAADWRAWTDFGAGEFVRHDDLVFQRKSNGQSGERFQPSAWDEVESRRRDETGLVIDSFRAERTQFTEDGRESATDKFVIATLQLPAGAGLAIRQSAEQLIEDPDGQYAGIRLTGRPSQDEPEIRFRAEDRAQLDRFCKTLFRLYPEVRLKRKLHLLGPDIVECGMFTGRFYPIYYNPHDSSQFLGFLYAVSTDEITADLVQARERVAYIYALVALGACLLGLFCSRWLTGPLRQITRAAEAFGEGRTDYPALPEGGQDEIGVLARTFSSMINRVQQRDLELRDRETRLRTIVKNASEAIILIRRGGKIESFNEAAQRIFGYDSKEATDDLRFSDLFGGQDQPLLEKLVDWIDVERAELESIKFTSPSNESGYHEGTGKRKDGSDFPAEFSISKVNVDAGRRIVTAIVRDVSSRKEAEQAIQAANDQLRQMNEELDQKVEQRTAQLKKSNDELTTARDHAMAAKLSMDTFLASMSHELRTPLNAIIGFGEILAEDAEEENNTQIIPDLQRIVDQGKHLLSLINEILDLAKVEAGKMPIHLEEFEVVELTSQVVSAMTPAAQKNNNTLDVEISEDVARIQSDRTKLRQLLYNLLSNACKFTQGGKVSLHVDQKHVEDRGQIVFRVTDTGIGMTDEQMGRLFEPFAQADDSISKKYGGTGLGLAISKRFCEIMGGTIRVESTFGTGSVFTVALPVAFQGLMAEDGVLASDDTVRKDAENRHAVPVNNTILVVDDDPSARQLIERYLVKAGFDVETAGCGQEAIEKARKIHPAAITLDIVLHDLDGFDVLEQLKSSPDTRDIPVIIVTMMDDRERGFALGAADYLTKPFDSDQLQEILQRHIGTSNPGVILVVEDDANAREIIRRSLNKNGWQTLEAENGQVAIELLAEQIPDLILLDIQMPVMNGIEFLDAMRGDERLASIPVIVITGSSTVAEHDRKRVQEEVRHVFMKGAYKREQLLDEIKRQVSKSVAEDRKGKPSYA